jgi:hypothetical protein
MHGITLGITHYNDEMALAHLCSSFLKIALAFLYSYTHTNGMMVQLTCQSVTTCPIQVPTATGASCPFAPRIARAHFLGTHNP